MSSLSELYQEMILEHNKSPRNFGKLSEANAMAHGKNPLCGDDYFVYLKISPNGRVEKVAFEGDGCAISKSSASMMTAAIQGKTIEEVQKMKDSFIHLLTDKDASDTAREGSGRLRIFEGVRQYPVRVKCATLSWRALEAALQNNRNEISTE